MLSGDGLLQTDAKEAAYDPFRPVKTEDVIDLLRAALEYIKIGNKKKGKKTTLLRDTAIALVRDLGGKPQNCCIWLHLPRSDCCCSPSANAALLLLL